MTTAVLDEPISAEATDTERWGCRLCTTCNDEISFKRLIAKPHAVQCVQCLEKAGDVPKLKRFDETMLNGDVIEGVIYVRNQYIDGQIERIQGATKIPNVNTDGVVIDRDLTVEVAQPMEEAYEEAAAAETEYRSQMRKAAGA